MSLRLLSSSLLNSALTDESVSSSLQVHFVPNFKAAALPCLQRHKLMEVSPRGQRRLFVQQDIQSVVSPNVTGRLVFHSVLQTTREADVFM